jgi:hypothetical protein
LREEARRNKRGLHPVAVQEDRLGAARPDIHADDRDKDAARKRLSVEGITKCHPFL